MGPAPSNHLALERWCFSWLSLGNMLMGGGRGSQIVSIVVLPPTSSGAGSKCLATSTFSLGPHHHWQTGPSVSSHLALITWCLPLARVPGVPGSVLLSAMFLHGFCFSMEPLFCKTPIKAFSGTVSVEPGLSALLDIPWLKTTRLLSILPSSI